MASLPARGWQMSEVPHTPADAEEFVETALGHKPQLIVHVGDLPATARALRKLLAQCEYLFDRDAPVKLVQPSDGGPMKAVPLTANTVVIETHDLCQPVKFNSRGELVAVTLPERVARMYLDMGEWNLRPLAGITTAPVLAADGSIRDVEGYDPETGLWCCSVPRLAVPERPDLEDAKTALRRLRATFKTFPFADAIRRRDPDLNVDVVDLAEPPGRDESAFFAQAYGSRPASSSRRRHCPAPEPAKGCSSERSAQLLLAFGRVLSLPVTIGRSLRNGSRLI